MVHALGQVQAAPHWHCGPQAQACCATGVWQPHVQAAPGQEAQLQDVWFVSFMVNFLGVCRRRDAVDG